MIFKIGNALKATCLKKQVYSREHKFGKPVLPPQKTQLSIFFQFLLISRTSPILHYSNIRSTPPSFSAHSGIEVYSSACHSKLNEFSLFFISTRDAQRYPSLAKCRSHHYCLFAGTVASCISLLCFSFRLYFFYLL